ncbi:MAG: hypothetical protein SFV15_05795 [Polyangiaceae bacterium]|nr:hypothetical protein [Polyangiaceae bacterium]
MKLENRSKYELALEVDYATELIAVETLDQCIQIRAMIGPREKATVQSQATACFEWRHLLFGISFGGDASKVYQSTLKAALSMLDKNVTGETLRAGGPGANAEGVH